MPRPLPAPVTLVVALLLAALAPGPASAQTTDEEASQALDTLRLARLNFDRGEFEAAVEKFASILDRPVKLQTRDTLHEGFLYYAFTLFLQGKPDRARDKLQFAFQLKPTFAPSPVTTRPDLLGFYNDEQSIYVTTNGDGEQLLASIFPELGETPGGGVVLRRRVFVPFFGIGLRQLGHARAGNLLLGTQLVSLAGNIAGIAVRAAYINDRTPKGWEATYIGRGFTYVSFGLFWASIVTDFVVSIALQRYYRKHPERLKTDAVRTTARYREPPRIVAGPGSMAVTFW